MTWLDALLGKIRSRGTDLDLEGAINFTSGLKATPNPGSRAIDVTVDYETLLASAPGGAIEYASAAALRAAAPPAAGTVVRLQDTLREYRYSTSGAGFADDGRTIIRPNSVGEGVGGRYFSTSGSAWVPTLDALRGIVSGLQTHVHVKCHTAATDGGGDTWDMRAKEVGDVDDNGTLVIAGDYVYERRGHEGRTPTPKWWGGAADYDPVSGTGGELDTAAIIACRAYARARKVSWEIPDGRWLLTEPIQGYENMVLRGESFDLCQIFCKCDTPLLLGETALVVTINGGAYIKADAACDTLCDVWGTYHTRIDIAAGGSWSRGVACYRDAGDRSTAGWWYIGELRVRDFLWRPEFGFPAPAKPVRPIHLDGEFIRLTVHPDYSQPADPDIGCLISNYSGAISHSLIVQGVCAGNGATEKPDIGVKIKGIKGVRVGDIYGESCLVGLHIEDCWSVTVDGTIDGGAMRLLRCINGTISPQQIYVLQDECTGISSHGGGFGNPDYVGSWESTNIDPVDEAFSFQTGQVTSRTGWVAADSRNLVLNGDFQRWTLAGMPWSWSGALPPGGTITKCGTGISDTTKTDAADYCMHITMDGVSSIVLTTKLTPPLNSSYVGSTITVRCKVKSANAALTRFDIASALGVPTGQLAVTQGLTPCEDGFSVFTGQWRLTENETATGLILRLLVPATADVYISEVSATFGRQSPRLFLRPTTCFDGSIEVLPSGIIRGRSATKPTGTVDPFFGATYLDHDQVTNIGADATFGWVYRGGRWNEIDCLDDESKLVAAIKAIDVSGKITRLVIGAHAPTGNVTTWPAAIGTSPTLYAATSPPTRGTCRGRPAVIFSNAVAAGQRMTWPNNCTEYWCLSRNDTIGNFTGTQSMIGGAGGAARLCGSSGSTNLINDSTITRDGTSTAAVDNLTRLWRATDTATTDNRVLGGYDDNNPANNWHGAIVVALAVGPVALTAEESAALERVLMAYAYLR